MNALIMVLLMVAGGVLALLGYMAYWVMYYKLILRSDKSVLDIINNEI